MSESISTVATATATVKSVAAVKHHIDRRYREIAGQEVLVLKYLSERSGHHIVEIRTNGKPTAPILPITIKMLEDFSRDAMMAIGVPSNAF